MLSEPRKSPSGSVITPSSPRTRTPSEVKGKLAATNITEKMTSGNGVSSYPASMADRGPGCVGTGNGLRNGSGASKAMHLVDPDPVRYPGSGRSLKDPFGEIELGGRWIMLLLRYPLHYLFNYKANACPGWWLIPE